MIHFLIYVSRYNSSFLKIIEENFFINLHTSIITDLNIFNERPESYYNAGPLMAANEGLLRFQWPVPVKSMQVCVADTGVLDVDKNFIWSRLLHWYFLIDEGFGT